MLVAVQSVWSGLGKVHPWSFEARVEPPEALVRKVASCECRAIQSVREE